MALSDDLWAIMDRACVELEDTLDCHNYSLGA